MVADGSMVGTITVVRQGPSAVGSVLEWQEPRVVRPVRIVENLGDGAHPRVRNHSVAVWHLSAAKHRHTGRTREKQAKCNETQHTKTDCGVDQPVG